MVQGLRGLPEKRVKVGLFVVRNTVAPPLAPHEYSGQAPQERGS